MLACVIAWLREFIRACALPQVQPLQQRDPRDNQRELLVPVAFPIRLCHGLLEMTTLWLGCAVDEQSSYVECVRVQPFRGPATHVGRAAAECGATSLGHTFRAWSGAEFHWDQNVTKNGSFERHVPAACCLHRGH